MKNKKNEPKGARKERENVAALNEDDADADFSGELNAPRWSVITFEKRVAKNLSYAEAKKKLQKLLLEKVSGLCIVSDEAADRIEQKN